MKVLVFGSRTFADRDLIHRHLDHLAAELPDDGRLYVINGFASGADRTNQQMIDEGRPDVALGYVDKPLDESRGSLDMYNRLIAAGVQVSVHRADAGERTR